MSVGTLKTVREWAVENPEAPPPPSAELWQRHYHRLEELAGRLGIEREYGAKAIRVVAVCVRTTTRCGPIEIAIPGLDEGTGTAPIRAVERSNSRQRTVGRYFEQSPTVARVSPA